MKAYQVAERGRLGAEHDADKLCQCRLARKLLGIMNLAQVTSKGVRSLVVDLSTKGSFDPVISLER